MLQVSATAATEKKRLSLKKTKLVISCEWTPNRVPANQFDVDKCGCFCARWLYACFCYGFSCARLLFFLCFFGKCIVVSELCDADAGGGPLYMKKCGGTCPHRLQIQGAECQYLTNMTYIAEIRLHFQTNYVALRLWDVFFTFIPMFAQFCTCTVLSFQFISSLIGFCNSSIARQTSVSSNETLIASFQTCQSNPQVFKLANACYILLQLTTSVVAGKLQYISIMQWPCAKYRFLLHGMTIQKGLQRPLLGKPNHP